MALPIAIANNSMIIPVNLSSSWKTITLPAISTNPGRFLIFKDLYGNAANSTLRLSTTGVDTIERSNVSSIVLSNAYGSWWFTNDGISRWFFTDAYFNSLYFLPPAGTFVPTSISNIQLWLDASDPNGTGVLPANNAVVTTWNDKSGFARNATGVNSPTYNSSNIVFGGSAYFNLDLDFLAGRSHFSFVVCSNTNFVNIYGAANGANGSNSLHVGFTNSSSYRMNYWGNDYQPNFVNYQASVYNLVEFFWNYNVSKVVYRTGALEGSNAQAGTPGTMSGGGRIAHVTGQGIFQGNIREILFYTSASGSPLTTLDQQKIEGYLAWKWGIQGQLPITHPYKNSPPTA